MGAIFIQTTIVTTKKLNTSHKEHPMFLHLLPPFPSFISFSSFHCMFYMYTNYGTFKFVCLVIYMYGYMWVWKAEVNIGCHP